MQLILKIAKDIGCKEVDIMVKEIEKKYKHIISEIGIKVK